VFVRVSCRAVNHPLSVLLWRLDPDCPTSNDKIPLDAEVILICREGYSSTFAALQLEEIGFHNVADVVGGVDAWKAAGLPLVQPASSADGQAVTTAAARARKT
jgi:rhodanese-related sulfurtransferase